LCIKRILINIICGFFPSKTMRHLLRAYANGCRVELTKPNGRRVINPFFIKDFKLWIKGKNVCVELTEPLNGFVEINSIGNAKKHVGIGKNFSNNGRMILYTNGEPITMGDDCLVSWNVLIMTSDLHAVIDKDSGKIINTPSQGISIGNHVWIGRSVAILKDVSIPDNSVIGLGSIITKSFHEPNVAIAGNPAKIIKKNINWLR